MDKNDRDYTNGEITVFWRPKECIHATTCFRELRAVFDPGKRPWVNMKGASTAEIIRVVNLCPTNALSYTYNKATEISDDGTKEEEQVPVAPPPVEVRVMRDGPLIVRGEFKTIGADGKEMKKMKMTSFCRCGHSKNMPYCDGAHRKAGWSSD
jgi:uncharacterized Fe-S cluster protein YjdI